MDSFCKRDSVTGEGGTFNFSNFFSGNDVALFGGLEYHAQAWPVTWKLEYDGNNYQREPQNNNLEQKIPFNFGVLYQYKNMIDMQLGFVRGTTFSLGLTFRTNFKKDSVVKYLDPKPVVVNSYPPPFL